MFKILAFTFMIIDHIGLFFFPEMTEFRIIGRLAFPFFAFHSLPPQYVIVATFGDEKRTFRKWIFAQPAGARSQHRAARRHIRRSCAPAASKRHSGQTAPNRSSRL